MTRPLKVFVPETCPICHHAIDVRQIGVGLATSLEKSFRGQVVFQCPRPPCERIFVGIYETAQAFRLIQNSNDQPGWVRQVFLPTEYRTREFETVITALSPRFGQIYSQASAAEHHGLDQICGPGYRKSLEFLIKDFLKSIHKEEKETIEIEAAQVGALIAKYVADPRLKLAASRAAWLGNDETHYVRKWENKDLGDLKKLIDLTIHWISMDVLTRDLEASMPAGGPPPPATGDSAAKGE